MFINLFPICPICDGIGCDRCNNQGFIDVEAEQKQKEIEITQNTRIPKFYSSLTAIQVLKGKTNDKEK